MANPEKPILLNLSLCDLVIRDAQSHKVSLINLFSELRAARFPCAHPRLYVYASLTNGRGTYACSLAMVDSETGATLVKLPARVSFRSPLQVLEMSFELNALKFPHPGTYRFEFLCDDEPLGARTLRATPVPKGPPAKA